MLSTVTRSTASRSSFLRTWLIWTAGFLAFPVVGLAGTAVAGRVATPVATLLGGAATAIGMGLGLLLGAVTVGYRTSLADLALMGALTGLVLGVAQAIALPHHTQLRWAWAAALPFLWALGWTVTTLAMVTVDEQFTVFGASGAVTFSALSGLLLHRLLPCRTDASPDRAPTPSGATP